jgi:hypothetical protein
MRRGYSILNKTVAMLRSRIFSRERTQRTQRKVGGIDAFCVLCVLLRLHFSLSRLVGRGGGGELQVVEVMEEFFFHEAGFSEVGGVKAAAGGPDEAFAVEVGPFPIGAVDGGGGVGAHEGVAVVIDAFALGVIDACVAVFAKCPAGAGGFVEDGWCVVVARDIGAQGPTVVLEAVEVNVQ